jgi:hypothetical protein
MSLYDDYVKDGDKSYRNGHYRESALAHEQARKVAKDFGMKREAFESGFWAAHSWENAGEILRALQVYMELLQAIPSEADSLDVWRAKKHSYEIRFFHFPQLATLERQLTDLEQLLREVPNLPPADGSLLRANLLAAQGQWAAQLNCLERGWQEYNGHGNYKYDYAANAISANLAVNNLTAAQRWAVLLAETETNYPVSRAAYAKAQIYLALYQQQPAQAQEHLSELERLNDDLQSAGINRATIALQIRCYLLQPALGDPQQRLHSARRRFAERVQGKPEVFDIYDRYLLRLDYRIASVRWALSVAAVDDVYYTQAQDLSCFNPRCAVEDIQQRIKRARRAVNCALDSARYLDDCFECSWRQQVIHDREQRLQALINLFNERTSYEHQ